MSKMYKATLKERQAEYKDGRRQPQVITEEQKAYYERILPGKYNFSPLPPTVSRTASEKPPIKGAEKAKPKAMKYTRFMETPASSEAAATTKRVPGPTYS